MEPLRGSDIDADIDWSDAGFYGFLESLADEDAPPRKKHHSELDPRGTGWQPTSVDVQAAASPPWAKAQPGSGPQADGAAVRSDAAAGFLPGLIASIQPTAPLHSRSCEGAAPRAQESSSSGGSGEQPALEQAHNPNGTLRRISSNSGDEGAKSMGVHKSGPDRDKNRAAQKAFRLRKKEQEKAKEALVEELAARLRAVQLEKARLELQNNLLESALLARMKLSAQQDGLQASTVAKAPSGRVITGAHNWKCNVDWEATDVLILEQGVQQRITPEVLQEMGIPGIKKLWKCYVNSIAACLAGAWKDESGEAGQRVQVLVSEATALMAYMGRNTPSLIHQFVASRPDDDSLALAAPAPALWKSIVKNLRLSEEQAAELLRQRRAFLEQIGSLLQERRRIQASIKEMDRAADAVALRDAMALRFCQLTEATKQLQANVKALHDHKCIFFSYCWREVLRPVQAANMLVQSFPFGPDLLAVLSCLSKEAGEPPARDILRAAAKSEHAPTSIEV
ncbi:hypothetical protein COCOBI_04-2350 [Coccomyxa sp. Obi]|nr:hypothetical protein COCOBI_04-2350 [Coccomyxa sp. Obi]